MKRCVPALIIAVLLACAWPAFSQEDMTHVSPAAFSSPTRPAAVFVHDTHNEKAGLDDCGICHHGGANGVKDTSATTEGTPCADCHKIQAGKGLTDLTHAYHKQCIGCHRTKGKGPLACGQCHKK